MPLWESVVAIAGNAIGLASATKDLRDFLNDLVKIEVVLADLTDEAFHQQVPRLRHLCLEGRVSFDKKAFSEALATANIEARHPDQLQAALLPYLAEAISTPTALYKQDDFLPVYALILSSALRGLWKKIAACQPLALETLLKKTAELGEQHATVTDLIRSNAADVGTQLTGAHEQLQQLRGDVTNLTDFAQRCWQQVYEKLFDTAPPSQHTIDNRAYPNPFLLVRAEDFNHNYDRLARLFQGSVEWDSIQRRTDNVFIEGGRGTGKSMLLRRLTAQATIAAERLQQRDANFDNIRHDYFGVYIKLTRGYYDQFTSIDTISPNVAELLARHELNIEILDAFAETLRWLAKERALPGLCDQTEALSRDLAKLFPKAPGARTLEELRDATIRFEQDQIVTYYREKGFARDISYQGSAMDTVVFVRRLSEVFRARLFPRRECRLFLLIDEFETLLDVQQIALNTVMKMRLPDISLKIGVRKSGRRTADTFTKGDPIQDPRDYTEVRLDYDTNSDAYRQLLAGIAGKRLKDADYPQTDIRAYLGGQRTEEEVSREELAAELESMWSSGRRTTDEMTEEFRGKYTTPAVYRILGRTRRRKSFCGFEHFALLSSGIVSNFIELCKYAFYFALADQLPLSEKPRIPYYHQTEAAYGVSQRLLSKIDGNVPLVGSQLSRLLADLGELLRLRLLNHASEPESNRLAVVDYGELGRQENSEIARIMDEGLVWSVFHLETPGEAFRPKNAARPPAAELIINRIYCPALRISPRSRWRVKIQVADLGGLADPMRRDSTYRRLVRTLGAVQGPDVNQTKLSFEAEV